MQQPLAGPTRRAALLGVASCALLTAGAPGGARAQARATQAAASGRPLVMHQIVDMSVNQQDVTKDFLVGARAAWQDFNARGGLKGRTVQVNTLETDGTPAALERALAISRADAGCIALTGCAGDAAARTLAELLARGGPALPLIAPWMHQAPADGADGVAAIFATREQQVTHAVRSLSVMGATEIGAVYASQAEESHHRADMQRTADALRLKVVHYVAGDDLVAWGQRLPARSPAVLLFFGGTPELVPFTQGLSRQTRQRYIIALADVNLQTVAQMGASRQTPLIATQVVPMVNSPLPIVRAYRELLARLFDEAPTPLSLSGYVSARYTQQLLLELDTPPSRATVLAEVQRRRTLDLGGFRVSFDAQGRPGGYVTQSMLSADGRVVG